MKSISLIICLIMTLTLDIYAQRTSFTAYEMKDTNTENGKSLTDKTYVTVIM